MKKYIIILYVIIGLAFYIPNASAQLSNDIGVQLSKTCITMIKNSLDTNCPTYEEIMFLFSDTSDQRISGQFVFEDGYYHRSSSKYLESEQFYRFDSSSRFWVDPPARVAQSIKLIVIEPRLDEYKIGQQVITNSSVSVGHQRWVNVECNKATISATDWQFLMGDTIQYLGSDCKTTNFDHIKKKTWERAIHDITTSYKFKLEQWIKQSLERCGQRICFYE